MIFFISILASALYCGLITLLFKTWEEIKSEDLPNHIQSDYFVSIIIVGRNESTNIEACLSSINENSYPTNAYEIIFIDDHSTDDTVEKIKNLGITNLSILHLSEYLEQKINAYKKAAIQLGIKKSKGELIMMTDADCWVPEDWIKRTVYNFKTKKIVFQTAAVTFSPIYKFLHWFQELDFLAMMATTNAGIRQSKWFLANGANLSFLKNKLPENYFTEANEFASGDDVFLINTFAQAYPKRIYFENQITVKTKPVNTLGEFIQQRIRWAGKNKTLAKGKMIKALFVPILFYLWCFILIFLSALGHNAAVWLLLCLLLIKILMDHALLHFVNKQISNNPKMKFFITSSLLYPIYFLVIGIWSIFRSNYQWKGRSVK